MSKTRRRPAALEVRPPLREKAPLPRCKHIAVLVAPEETSAVRPSFPFLANLFLALLLVGIVVGWFANAPARPEWVPGYVALALTTLALATIALVRPPARRCDERWWVYLVCLMSILYVLAYRFDGRQTSMVFIFWGRVALQFCANLWMLSLGESYGMLPALRSIRTRLLYRHVRHPAYAMYILADLGAVCLQPSWWNAGVAVVGVTLFVLRARLEERVLCHDPAYADYMGRVRWRFMPGLA